MVHIHSDIKRGLCLLLLSLNVLTAGTSQASSNATLSVFTCEPEWAALVKQLGGDRVYVYSATTAKQDPHHVQARPSLIAKARRADLLVCSGAELEIGWLPLLLRKAGNSRVMTDQGQFYAADYGDKLEIPERVDRSMGDVHAQGNGQALQRGYAGGGSTPLDQADGVGRKFAQLRQRAQRQSALAAELPQVNSNTRGFLFAHSRPSPSTVPNICPL